MLHIDRKKMIGKGRHRECFVHPDDENKCIKVVVYGDEKETEREQSYYQRLSKRQISWSMLSQYYGVVETNLGQGAVFELIRDYTGEVSRTLEDYLLTPNGIEFPVSRLLHSLRHLKKYLLQEKIITMTIKPKNIVYQRYSKTEGCLIIVDNIGHSDCLRLCDHFDWWASRKIERKWARFESVLVAH
jgi:PhoP regulatory network protein YrbL